MSIIEYTQIYTKVYIIQIHEGNYISKQTNDIIYIYIYIYILVEILQLKK